MDSTVTVIGGGLAGLTAALLLAKAGVDVLVIEKKAYPSHKVCGEYVSNEVRPFLEELGVPLNDLGATVIDQLVVSSPRGTLLKAPLELGGFGLSRYALDHCLYQLCRQAGVRFWLNTSVVQATRVGNSHELTTQDGRRLSTRVAIGAYGKRSNLDIKKGRTFTRSSSPFLAVKYHIRFEHPDTTIFLHNFEGGYCGMSAIEGGTTCLCYLTTRANLKKAGGSIQRMQAQILSRNPHLKRIFSQAEFLYEKPLVINEISFKKKDSVEDGLLMIGDSAGLITPLCGNGMAMAIDSAKALSELIVLYLNNQLTVQQLENQYRTYWRQTFGTRVAVGRVIQSTFGNSWLTESVVMTLKNANYLTTKLIHLTHGKKIIR